MNEIDVYRRFEQLLAEIHSERIRIWVRHNGDLSSWTRQRDMPLEGILLRTLAKKGLSATMEARHYFQAVEKAGQPASRIAYGRGKN
jgi:hypothetical protein